MHVDAENYDNEEAITPSNKCSFLHYASVYQSARLILKAYGAKFNYIPVTPNADKVKDDNLKHTL